MPDAVNRESVPRVDGGRFGALSWRTRCLGCGAAGVPGRDLCAACHARLPWLAPDSGACMSPLHATTAAFLYAPPLDRWLPRFKFHRDLAAGRLLSQLMLEVVGGVERPQALLPIPLHHARLRQRGYDQALELAKPLAAALAIPLMPQLLQRTRATAPQSELDRADRHRNLRGAFAVRDEHALPRHVVLVDDVMTTGSTLQAAAAALRAAGVERVDAWVCARVP